MSYCIMNSANYYFIFTTHKITVPIGGGLRPLTCTMHKGLGSTQSHGNLPFDMEIVTAK